MSGGVGRRTSGSRLRLSSTGTCGGRTGPSHRAGAEGAQPRLTGAGHGPPPSCQSPGGLEGEPQEPWDAHGLDFEPTVPSHVTEWPSLLWVSNGRRHRSLPQCEGQTPDPGPAATHHGLEPARAPGSRPRARGPVPSVGGEVAAGGGAPASFPRRGGNRTRLRVRRARAPRCGPVPPRSAAPADAPHPTGARQPPGSHAGWPERCRPLPEGPRDSPWWL